MGYIVSSGDIPGLNDFAALGLETRRESFTLHGPGAGGRDDHIEVGYEEVKTLRKLVEYLEKYQPPICSICHYYAYNHPPNHKFVVLGGDDD